MVFSLSIMIRLIYIVFFIYSMIFSLIFGLVLAMTSPFHGNIPPDEAFMRAFKGGRFHRLHLHIMHPSQAQFYHWLRWQERPNKWSLTELESLMASHPSWPILPQVYRYRETLALRSDTAKMLQVFAQFSPTTGTAWQSYLWACAHHKKPWPKTWPSAPLTPEQWRFLLSYKPLEPYLHAKLRQCFEKKKMTSADLQLVQALMPLVHVRHHPRFAFYYACVTGDKKTPELWKKLSLKDQGESWIWYHYGRYYLRHRQEKNVPFRSQWAAQDPALCWLIHRALTLDLLLQGNRTLALNLLGKVSYNPLSKEGREYAWMRGWIVWRFFHHPQRAWIHFQRCVKDLRQLPLKEQARYAYWMSRLAQQLGRKKTAHHYRTLAQKVPGTYYGQLALQDGGKAMVPPQLPRVSGMHSPDWVQKVHLLKRLPEGYATEWIQAFARKNMPRNEKDLAQFLQTFQGDTALQMGAFGVVSSQPYKVFFPRYCLKKSVPSAYHTLVWSIMHQESRFNAQAVSCAGAKGLMQVMPASAQPFLKQEENIFHPGVNIRVGWEILKKDLHTFKVWPFAIAAYNAGGHRVTQWKRSFPWPKGQTFTAPVWHPDYIDWIEAIPFQETQHYVKSVLRNYLIYTYYYGKNQRGAV